MAVAQPAPLFRRFPSLLPAVAFVSALLPAFSPAWSGTAAGPRWIAGAICQEGEKLQDMVMTEVSGVSIQARPLPAAEWEARLEHTSAGMGGALRRHDGSEGPFQVFLLTLRNQSPEVLRFQPGNLVRILGDRQQDHIMDFTDLYRYLVEEEKNPDSLDRIRGAFFDSELALDRGESVERVVFFQALPEKGKKKQLTLLLSSFQVGTETLRAALSWHAEKEKP
jgi:hypothetical protein